MPTFLHYAQFLLDGAWMTVKIAVPSAIFAGLLALGAGIARTSTLKAVRIIPTAYIEVFRGTPCYAQLFWVFFVSPFFGVHVEPFVAAVFVFGSNIGSYGSEVVRGAILSVPRGQTEAGIALNFTYWQRFRYIIFPQSLLTMLPPAGSLAIDLVKLTSLASLVTVSDLTYNALVIRQQTGNTVLSILVILIGYFFLTSLCAWGSKSIEHRALSWNSAERGGTA